MTGPRSQAAAIVAWIDENQARRQRETLRAQGRNQVLHALLRGTLQIRNPATGEWIKIPSPWTDTDQQQWGMTREQIAQLAISYEGLPPDDDSTAVALARLEALRSVR